MEKKSGVLLPVFSLPGDEGIGCFNYEAYHFVDNLKECGFHIWQVLPLNALNKDYSPYQAISSFAGETLYISLEKLVDMGLLESYEKMDNTGKVDYPTVSAYKEKYLKQAFEAFDTNHPYYAQFKEYVSNTKWVDSFTDFKALYVQNGEIPWNEWTIHEVDSKQKEFEAFKQYLFYRQWFELKLYATSKGIEIMGDLPFYIGFNSQDVFEHQSYFLLDETTLKPTHVSGVPPDYFNEDGQRWDHPIYNWDEMEKNHFDYWIDKIKQSVELYDLLRLDHFRAFDTYWKIDVNGRGARIGEWLEAPGDALFEKLFKEYPSIQLVAEDLGYLRKEVIELKDKYKLDGMRVFQFSVDEVLHKTLPSNIVFYTGTHDNDTLVGWLNTLSADTLHMINEITDDSNLPLHLKIVSTCLKADCNRVIVPLQDLLGLDNSARINAPGTMNDQNWSYRFNDFNEFNRMIPAIKNLVESAKK